MTQTYNMPFDATMIIALYKLLLVVIQLTMESTLAKGQKAYGYITV